MRIGGGVLGWVEVRELWAHQLGQSCRVPWACGSMGQGGECAFIYNTSWKTRFGEPANSGTFVGSFMPNPTRARLQDLKDVEKQSMRTVLGTQQCGEDGPCQEIIGRSFKGLKARSREFQYRIVQSKSRLSPEETHTKMGQLIFNKDAKAIQWGKDNLFNR